MRPRRRSSEVATISRLIRELERMRKEIARLERRQPLRSFGAHRSSARNLVDYLAFRRFDARHIQEGLAQLGLSSLGHAESHVRDNLDSVLRQLYLLSGRPHRGRTTLGSLGPDGGRVLIDRHARRLLGPPRPGRRTRIMVTVPTEAATDPALVGELLRAGMDSMRINCAHDSPRAWTAMIAHLRRAERATGRRCRVEMDLSGPRLRIGPMAPGPAVVKIRPRRDAFGRVIQRGRLRLVARGVPDRPADDRVPTAEVSGDWLMRLRRGSSGTAPGFARGETYPSGRRLGTGRAPPDRSEDGLPRRRNDLAFAPETRGKVGHRDRLGCSSGGGGPAPTGRAGAIDVARRVRVPRDSGRLGTTARARKIRGPPPRGTRFAPQRGEGVVRRRAGRGSRDGGPSRGGSPADHPCSPGRGCAWGRTRG